MGTPLNIRAEATKILLEWRKFKEQDTPTRWYLQGYHDGLMDCPERLLDEFKSDIYELGFKDGKGTRKLNDII